MSHFFLLALVPPNETDLERHLAAKMEPYGEERDVKPHQEPCWCVGRSAREEVHEQVTAEVGSIDSFRQSFRERPDVILRNEKLREFWQLDRKLTKEEKAAHKQLEAELGTAWQEYIAPYQTRERALREGHPLRESADPSCDNCHGSGTYESTSNPRGYWDWWQIGGRWTGALDGYDPATDPKNIEECFLCGGTGTREMWPEYRESAEDEAIAALVGGGVREADPIKSFLAGKAPEMVYKPAPCNGCAGKGQRVKWPGQFARHPGDVQLVTALDFSDDDRIPFAILTPTGGWYQKGEMGWFAMVHHEQSDDQWVSQARGLLDYYKDCYAVVVDCHT